MSNQPPFHPGFEGNPIQDQEVPPLTFDQLEERIVSQLSQLDVMQRAGAHPAQIFDMQTTILFGAFAELLKTLRACKIEPKRIQVIGASGHG